MVIGMVSGICRIASVGAVLPTAAILAMLSFPIPSAADAIEQAASLSEAPVASSPEPEVGRTAPSSAYYGAQREEADKEQWLRIERDQDRYYKEQAEDARRRYEQMDREADRYYRRP